MIFTPQKYKIEDRPGMSFIDPDEINSLLKVVSSRPLIEQAIATSLSKTRLTLLQTAVLLNAPLELRPLVLKAAQDLKEQIYGNRIVLFAPLYVGNRCTNRCAYCTFRADNTMALRKTLSQEELSQEVTALENEGHKRLILVFGEHPDYSAEYIAQAVRTTYGVHSGKSGEIRRVNINAAPLSVADFMTVASAGIGTYQIFQETYDPQLYLKYHLAGKKRDYNWRLTALDRAMQGGIDDVGLGALLGLGDWRYEVMGLVRHTNHLESCFDVGPHTISFPRITEALGADSAEMPVKDADFIYAIAVLRLAVPYTGLILTAREGATLRDVAIRYGVSQIDGGSKLEIGSYSENKEEQGSSQFTLHDNRSLGEVVSTLIHNGRLPSFCTACYRKGRTGEHFMEFSTAGFIKRFCTPNAVLTLAEYLEDYANSELRKEGYDLIYREELNTETLQRLEKIRQGERDLYF
ncbi:MAG: [FeFe] hydrogenase H-cluster radical SAM maturase HydG [Mucinivorans sp.]